MNMQYAKNQRSSTRIIVFISTIFTLSVLFAPPLVAQGAVSQEVNQNVEVSEGTLVSLVSGQPREVALADRTNGDYLFGVVTTTGKTLAEIGTDTIDGLPVATTGDVSVVVSTINGDVFAGDVLGISDLKGVAAKASTSEGATTIGVALEDFNSSSTSARDVISTTESGDENTVTVGTIAVRLAINDFYIDDIASSNVLVSVGERFVGKPVSQGQVVAASAIVLASILVGGFIMWNAVRGGFISIGRNPLSGNAVFNGLYYVTLLSVAIIIGGFVAGYIVLLL